MFEGQIRNGGINQLFINAPDNTLCILESFKELGLNEFQTEYTALCRALFGPFQNLPNLKNILSSEDSYRTEKFSNFIDYGIKIESGIKIEEMLFDKTNDEIIGHIMRKYIDDNYSKFYKLQ